MRNLFGPQGPPGWLVTGGMASIALAYVFLAYLPSQKAMRTMRQQLDEKRNYILEADKKYSSAPDKRYELDSARKYVKQWQTDAPDPTQADRLQSQVSQKASVAGVKVVKLQAQQSKPHGLFAEYPILVSVEGNFAGIFDFFRGVEELPQTVWLQDVKLLRPGELKGDLRCDLTLTI